MPDQAHTAPSAVMAASLQQQRFDRLRAARRIVRTLTFLALVAYAITLLAGRSGGSDSELVPILIGCGLLAWLIAFVCDYRVHSNRLDSRMSMMRLRAVQAQIDELQRLGGHGRGGPGLVGRAVVSGLGLEALHEQLRRLGAELDASEDKVERALIAATLAAILGTLAIILGVAISASLLR